MIAIKINEHSQMIDLIHQILMKSPKKSSILEAKLKGIKKPNITKIREIIIAYRTKPIRKIIAIMVPNKSIMKFTYYPLKNHH